MSTRHLRWVSIVSVFVVLACTGGDKGGQPKDTAATTTTPASTASAGEMLYQQRCITCHQATGEGLPGTYPPLAGSEYATAADPGVAARIVIHGIQGPIVIRGQSFNNLMPPYGVGVEMSDEEIAQLLTYVRSSFGNAASAVTAAQVAEARKASASTSGPMTAELLKPLLK